MSNKKEIIIWLLLIVSLSLGVFSVFNKEKESTLIENKIAYVDLTAVFQGFEMKEEIQTKLEADLRTKQSVLDSLMFQLQTLNNQLKSEKRPNETDVLKFEELRKQYISQKETFTLYSEEQTKKYDDQVLSQLTQYIKDYGLKNKYEILLGATGNGTILYGAKQKDITKEVIEYINLSYQGKN